MIVCFIANWLRKHWSNVQYETPSSKNTDRYLSKLCEKSWENPTISREFASMNSRVQNIERWFSIWIYESICWVVKWLIYFSSTLCLSNTLNFQIRGTGCIVHSSWLRCKKLSMPNFRHALLAHSSIGMYQ